MMKYTFLFLLLFTFSFEQGKSEICVQCMEKSVSEWVPFGFQDFLTEPQFECYGKPHSKWVSWKCSCGNVYYEQNWCSKGKLSTLYYAERTCNCSAKRQKYKNSLNTLLAQECECKGKRVAYVKQ